jgi:AraC family transcriptional regulator of adaptative response/methylated-DNA-[protein]-cysteine methyltransferase
MKLQRKSTMSADYLRVEKAIKYLEENYQEQPSLKELADHLNMSSFHFQRMFKRWAGISPKRFLQFLTIEHAKKVLEQNRSLLEATYDSGLSSPGRLHDLFVSIEAMTPGEFKTKGMGLKITYGIHPTPFGECLLAVSERGICGLDFITDDSGKEAEVKLKSQWQEAMLNESKQRTKPYVDQIFAPSQDDGTPPVSLFLKGTNFQIKVWEALLRIPPGSLCSYEDIAAHIGKPTAARAVGNAVGANPIAFIIPCHRVIRKIGVFGNYAHGSSRKKAMIGWEAAQRHRG